MLFDTHCHLDAAEFAADRDTQVAQARAAGVGEMLVPAVEQANFADTLAMRARYGCRVALGPPGVSVAPSAGASRTAGRLAGPRTPRCRGRNRPGFYLPELDPAQQEALFVAQLRLARARQLPVVLHLRRAQDRVLKYLRQVGVPGGIAHAFNGSRQQAEAFIALGFKLGFGGDDLQRFAAHPPTGRQLAAVGAGAGNRRARHPPGLGARRRMRPPICAALLRCWPSCAANHWMR